MQSIWRVLASLLLLLVVLKVVLHVICKKNSNFRRAEKTSLNTFTVAKTIFSKNMVRLIMLTIFCVLCAN
jgi:hypothetical protein